MIISTLYSGPATYCSTRAAGDQAGRARCPCGERRGGRSAASEVVSHRTHVDRPGVVDGLTTHGRPDARPRRRPPPRRARSAEAVDERPAADSNRRNSICRGTGNGGRAVADRPKAGQRARPRRKDKLTGGGDPAGPPARHRLRRTACNASRSLVSQRPPRRRVSEPAVAVRPVGQEAPAANPCGRRAQARSCRCRSCSPPRRQAADPAGRPA